MALLALLMVLLSLFLRSRERGPGARPWVEPASEGRRGLPSAAAGMSVGRSRAPLEALLAMPWFEARLGEVARSMRVLARWGTPLEESEEATKEDSERCMGA